MKEEEWSVADDEYVLHQVFQVVRAFSKTLNNEIYRSGIYSAEWTVLRADLPHDGRKGYRNVSEVKGPFRRKSNQSSKRS